MSVYFNKNLENLRPYVPGEQPQCGEKFVKLNTNENPFSPARRAKKYGGDELRLYPDPECGELTRAIAEYYGVKQSEVLPVNGSDEALAFSFAAFGGDGAVFPDVTYGFYKVFASLFNVKYREIPLADDFTVNTADYEGAGTAVFLANPNAQTGIYLDISEIERIVAQNPENVVVIDEAYIDFGGVSAVPLIKKYRNLVVVQTFSKSRSLAGARVGFAIADESLIGDLKRVKYSFNPYNVNRASIAAAVAAIKDEKRFEKSRSRIMAARSSLTVGLKSLGFEVLPSLSNFVLVRNSAICGGQLYKKLKERGFLVRHFDDARINDFVRITVGSERDCARLLKQISIITEEENAAGANRP